MSILPIMADDMGYSDLGCYGDEIDRFAAGNSSDGFAEKRPKALLSVDNG